MLKKNKFIIIVALLSVLLLFFKIFKIENYLQDNIHMGQLYKNLISKNVANRHVILSTNLDNENLDFYYFYLPITCASWRRINYEPIVILISSDFNNLSPQSLLTLKYLTQMAVKTIRINTSKKLDVFIAMISRLFVGLLPDELVRDEDFVITSDTDIIPYNKTYYYSFKAESDIVIWNAYCCGSFNFKGDKYTMYPLSHIGMVKKNWKKVMNIQSEDYEKLNEETIMKIMKKLHGDSEVYDGERTIQRGDQFWYMDQKTISVNIVKNGKELRVDKIQYRGARQDRSISSLNQWILNLKKIKDKLTDFHMFHADVFKKVESINLILELLFANEQMELIDYFKIYTSEFIELRKREKTENTNKNIKIEDIFRQQNLYSSNEIIFLSDLYEKILRNPISFIEKYVKLPFDYGFGSNSIPLTITSLLTTGDVLELGMGFFSTPLLSNVTSDYDRRLVSVDTKFEWLSKFLDYNKTQNHNVFLVDTESIIKYGSDKKWGLVLVDHSTAATRYINIIDLAQKAQIVVAHDAERPSDHMYKYEEKNVRKYYKYSCKFSIYTSKDKSWYYSTLILSNWYDVKILEPIFNKVKTDYGHVACDLNL